MEKAGAKGESNPRPLAPKARIIPLDHWPALHLRKDEARGIRTPNLRVWNPTRCHCAIGSGIYSFHCVNLSNLNFEIDLEVLVTLWPSG